MSNEIILYRPDELAEHIEVRLKEDTVWLSQDQLTQLFHRDQSVISRHIGNVFKEGELDEKSNMQKMHIPNSDKPVAFYNLDVIISVGYRVKSKQGTQFRIWATNVLRDYLLKGYALNQRMDRIENNYENLSKEVKQISFQLKTQELPNQGIFFDGQIFDAYAFSSNLIKKAKNEIILIDNYIDESTITHLTKKADKVKAILYTKILSKQLKLDIQKANEQYNNTFELNELKTSHDRFLIIDQKELYHLGASLKDLGKKWFAFSKMDHLTATILFQLNTKA
jgi:hypothetical protein